MDSTRIFANLSRNLFEKEGGNLALRSASTDRWLVCPFLLAANLSAADIYGIPQGRNSQLGLARPSVRLSAAVLAVEEREPLRRGRPE